MARRWERLLGKVAGYISDLSLLEKIAYVLALPIAGGLFYVMVEKPPAMGGYGMVFPSTRGQTSSELMLSALGYSLGTLGFYLIFTAKKHVHNPRYATFQVLAGALMIVLSVMYLLVMLGMKR